MKKIISLLLLSFIGINVYAQKQYVYVSAKTSNSLTDFNIFLSGNLPTDINKKYWEHDLGDVLNLLSNHGYNMDYCFGDKNLHFIFSKADSNTNNIRQISSTDNSEVHEVARYNLQGMPINESEKGVQIVVYSNYTMKTINNE